MCPFRLSENYDCEVTIKKNGKVVKRFENDYVRHQIWLQAGLFNFLGSDEKQLIVHYYSGGMNCCYFYEIYDLKPTFRKIYGEISEDASVDVGKEVFPMDLDNDGVFEFYRRVMVFHHTEAALQPAIFQYDRKAGQYKVANRKFRKYVSNEYEELVKEYEKDREQEPLSKESEKQLRMSKFASLIYSGLREEAWKYFDENIHHEFKKTYRERILKELEADSTYRAIYR